MGEKELILKKSLITILFGLQFIPLFAQTQDNNKPVFNLTGSIRFRGTSLARDVPISRNTTTFPVVDIPGFYQTQATNRNALIFSEVEAKFKNQPSVISKQKERLDYMDSRILMNLEIKTSENFDAVAGFVVWDVIFGGRALQPNGPNANNQDPLVIGPGSGGEISQSAGVNVQASNLYLNYKLKDHNFSTRFGIQFFSSVQGRVMFSTGAGFLSSKEFVHEKIAIEGGWIRGRERSLADVESNGLTDKNYQNTNIFFGKFRYFKLTNYKLELYSYFLNDTDPTDAHSETGKLFWHGWFNELNIGKFSVIGHGIYNHGKVSYNNIFRDNNSEEVYRSVNHYKNSGYLLDLQLNYQYNRIISGHLVGIGTSGRPGTDRDGMPSNYKGNGYRTLAPGYGISNIAIDFVGGYALFNARNMSGLAEYGGYVNATVFGPLQITLGYYQLHAVRAPRLSTNREYNSLFSNKSSTFIGQEFNFNFRWAVYSEFQLIFRSGIFLAGPGLNALNDYTYGNYLKEAFLMGEYKF